MFIEFWCWIWLVCVIMDRWYGVVFGIFLIVDIFDCDVFFFVLYEIIFDVEFFKWFIEISYMGFMEYFKLLILMGWVLKMVYSLMGLKNMIDIILG